MNLLKSQETQERKRAASRVPVYFIGIMIGVLLLWMLFLSGRIGLPESFNFWVTVGLIAIMGAMVVINVSMSLIESVRLDNTHVRIRRGLGISTNHGYHEIEAIVPDGDRAEIIFKDGTRYSTKNLRFGDSLDISKLNAFLRDKAHSGEPGLSILKDPGDPARKVF